MTSICQKIFDQIDHFANHEDVLISLKGLVETAKTLRTEERKISLLSVQLVGPLVAQNGAGNYMMSQEKFARHIGLTPDQFFKRSQAYRVLKNYPQLVSMLKSGETCVSHVAMVSAKITPANAELLAVGMKGKSTREVRDLLAKVTCDGQLKSDEETFVDLKFHLSKTQMDLLERSREILAHGGHVPSHEEILAKALEELLDRRDPLKKAERAAAAQKSSAAKQEGAQKSSAAKQEPEEEDAGPADAPTQGTVALKQRASRPSIPAKIRHLVWLRDEGACTYRYPDGTLCGSKVMVELDHQLPWARGGSHTVENLELRCRSHNQWQAVQTFGQEYMRLKSTTNQNNL